MASSVAASRSEPVSLTPSVAERVCYGLLPVVTLPLLVAHLKNLWIHRPHYQFFPAVLITAAILIYQRWPARSDLEQARITGRLSSALLWGGVGIIGLSAWWFSPWLGAIGWVLALGGVLIHLTGSAGIRELSGPWLLLWLIIPPPWPLDDEAIRALQDTTASVTGSVLEFVGVNHLLTGKVFRLPDRELFVAEACSGIHSQLVLVAAAAIFVVATRRPWLHAVLLVSSALFWSVAMNVIRVGLVVLAAAQFQMDLSTGVVHELLGHALLICGFLLLLSTDQLIFGLMPHRLYIAAQPPPHDDDEPDSTLTETEEEPPRVIAAAANSRSAKLLLVLFSALGLVQVILVLRQPPAVKADPTEFVAAFPQTTLPEAFGQWQLTSFESVERDRTSDAGHFSRIWHYDFRTREALFSVDFPFLGWHDLSRCYIGRGWDVHQQRVHEGDGWQFVEVELTRPTGEYGLLFYALMNASAEPAPIPGRMDAHLRTRMDQPRAARLAAESDITIQCQQFIVNEYRFLEEERIEMLDAFESLRTAARREWLRHQESP